MYPTKCAEFTAVVMCLIFCWGNSYCQQNDSLTSASSSKHPHATTTHASSSSSTSSEDQLAPVTSPLPQELQGTLSSSCITCPQTVCTVSKISYVRKAIHHNWRIDGLPDHIAYLEKFQVPFQLQASEVRFNATPPLNGPWTFTLTRASLSSSSLELRVTYRYMTTSNNGAPPLPKISNDLWLSIHVEDEYVTLPSQISSQPSLQVSAIPGNKNLYSWTYLFLWSDIQTKLINLIESHSLESQLVEFKFVINSYQEGDPTTSDADCSQWIGPENAKATNSFSLSSEPDMKISMTNPSNSNSTWPPFLSSMYAIMKDNRYADLTVKSGDDEFQIHRVIASYSSPVLGAMIDNMTDHDSVLDFGEDMGSDVVEELIRYMYTGRVEDIHEIADRLLVASSTYGFPNLKRHCEQVLVKQVKTENAFNMYSLGVEVGSMRLKRRAFNIMKENKSKIVAQSEEFRKLSVHHPDVMYELFLS